MSNQASSSARQHTSCLNRDQSLQVNREFNDGFNIVLKYLIEIRFSLSMKLGLPIDELQTSLLSPTTKLSVQSNLEVLFQEADRAVLKDPQLLK